MGKKRYNHYSYGLALAVLKQWPDIKREESIGASVWTMAINKALNDTKKMEDGEKRIEAIEKIYFKKELTIDGAAKRMNVSYRTIQRWQSLFVRMVAKNAGF